MELFQKIFIDILHAAFFDRSIAIPSNFEWEKAVDLAKKHNIASILFYGSLNCNVPLNSEHMQNLHRLTLHSLTTSIRQAHEISQIEQAFERNCIEYMPLKGIVLKSVYPKPEMRTMGDADILIKLDQYPKIEKIMSELGFTFQQETNHELIWTKPSLFLELHKSIMTSYNKDLYSYWGDGWKFAKQGFKHCKYEMSEEDFYLFLFIHFTKHYRISGIGIKHLLDLWVYINAHPDLNWKYITNELKALNLLQFHKNISHTIDVWFKGKKENDITNLITNVIFSSGQYGSKETAIINRALQNGKKSALKIKLDSIFKSIFLPYHVMTEKYSLLKKLSFLLPIMWLIRCFDVFFHQNNRLKKYMQRIAHVSSSQITESTKMLHAVGLNFDSKE